MVTALCIVGNKIDLQDKVKVSTERGQRLANSFNAAFTESSAKQNIGKVVRSFQTISSYLVTTCRYKRCL